jgi:hypothetical protein
MVKCRNHYNGVPTSCRRVASILLAL